MTTTTPAAPAKTTAPAKTAAPAGTKRVGTPAPATPPAQTPGATPGAAPAAAEGAAPVKRGGGITRDAFDPRTAVNADGTPAFKEVDGKALLTALPANYDVRKHKALDKPDFTADQAGEASFYDYKAAVADNMRAIYQKSVDDYRTQAANVRKYGNTEQRKLANKAQTMVTEFQALLDQMRKEGVDTSELEKMLAGGVPAKA